MATHRKPRSFKLNEATTAKQAKTGASSRNPRKPKAVRPSSKITLISDDEANGLLAELEPPAHADIDKTRNSPFGTILLVAGGTLFALALGIALDNLIQELFDRHPWLGWLGSGLALLFGIALLALIVREIVSIARLATISKIRAKAEEARATDNLKLARHTADQLTGLLSSDPSSANARTNLTSHLDQVTSGADLIHITETQLFKRVDAMAAKLIMNSAKRVSVVTAVSPRAIVDILYVLMENLRLIRTLSQLYGGRPGMWGLLRLSRNVLTHLAATGAISLGDSLLQQFVGHGLAARLSTRLGEGVLNGLLTARIGISAMDICRPMKFHALQRPGVTDFLTELLKLNGSTKGE